MALTNALARIASCSVRHRICLSHNIQKARQFSVSPPPQVGTSTQHPFAYGANDEVTRLAASRRRPLTLADLLKYAWCWGYGCLNLYAQDVLITVSLDTVVRRYRRMLCWHRRILRFPSFLPD